MRNADPMSGSGSAAGASYPNLALSGVARQESRDLCGVSKAKLIVDHARKATNIHIWAARIVITRFVPCKKPLPRRVTRPKPSPVKASESSTTALTTHPVEDS